MIPLSVPCLDGNEWRYLKECLDTNWVSSVGPFVDKFEQLIAQRLGAKHAVATSTGTAALHTALLVADVKPNDAVLVPALTFVATANAVRYVGADPVFIDVDPTYWQMDPQLVTEFLERQCRVNNGQLHDRATGQRIKAVIPVHLLGHPVDIDPIIEISHSYGLHVIEDAAESIGAQYRSQAVGHLGDIACFSFNGNKIITSGSGGMIVTDNSSWAERARYLTTQAKNDASEYVHDEIGFNYRMTNVHAALGCAQLEQLDSHVSRKRAIARRYLKAFEQLEGIEPMRQAPWALCTYWLFTILVAADEFGMDSRQLRQRLASLGIESRPLWRPLHLNRPYDKGLRFPVSERLHQCALSLPSSPALSREEQAHVIEAVWGALQRQSNSRAQRWHPAHSRLQD